MIKMKQKRRWFFASATDETDLTEINFKQELMKNGEPLEEVVDFYDGRLIPEPSKGQTYVKRSNGTRMLVTDVEKDKVIFMEHKYPCGKELPTIDFLKIFKLEQ